MAQCMGTTRDNLQCTTIVPPEQDYCYWHDPARAGERRRNASKGGKSKPNRELQDIKARLRELAEDVLAGSVDRSDAAVVGQLLNTMIRAVGVELKVREQLDVLERIEELETLLERQNERRGRYGA